MLGIRLFAVAAIVEHGPAEGIAVAGFESAMRWPGVAPQLGSKASHCDSSASTCIRLLIPALRDQGADCVDARDLPQDEGCAEGAGPLPVLPRPMLSAPRVSS